MNIMKEIHNKLLNRREVSALLAADSNPGLVVARQNVAQHFSVSEEHVVVKKLSNNYGKNDFFVDAFVYDNLEAMQKLEKVKEKVGAKK